MLEGEKEMTSKKILMKTMTEVITIQQEQNLVTKELIRCLGKTKNMKMVKRIHGNFKKLDEQRDRLTLVSNYVAGELLKK